jgi:uncharacterized metal-binding protein YceD (DUF177 family)
VNAKPKVSFDGERLFVSLAADVRDGLWIECEVTHPPSRAGQKVQLHVDEATRELLFRELKSEMTRARRNR